MDEFNLWASAIASSKTDITRICSKLATNTRHDRVDLYCTGHHAGSLNKWIRRVIDYRVMPFYNELSGWLKYTVFEYDFIKHGDALANPRVIGDYIKTGKFYAPPYFQLYNSYKRIDAPQRLKEIDKESL